MDYQENIEQLKHNHAKFQAEKKREIKRNIRLAYKNGSTVHYDMRTLLESGVSPAVIRAVYRGK